MDLAGFDIGYRAKLARHAVTGDPRDPPSRTVTELVERGKRGVKTGKGFHTYDPDGTRYPRNEQGEPGRDQPRLLLA